MTTQLIKERDYFTDPSVLLDPYSYFEEMRPRGPVCQLETHDCLLVTGFAEAAAGLDDGQFGLLLKPYTVESLANALMGEIR